MQKKNIESFEMMFSTMEHGIRTGRTAYYLALEEGLTDVEVYNTVFGAVLHDIGKFNLDEHILSIPGRLTEEQYAYVKNHAAFGFKLLSNSFNQDIQESVLHHHERLDGSGYMHKKEFSICTKIIAIADVYDALTNKRCYQQKVFTHQEAIAEMKKNNGFDRRLLDHLECMMDDNKKVIV
ncbi:HD domain-containing protein (plasmid) [Vallitalea pronyensis]|uniref:HD domain-containing protein n=1 Tax=Vallitalea pronyensis TaxID=1348613 RepID=A0A8J8SJT6_9FIRM|nr:HD domain-containing phosphohydrolase [Vallitalea pronyensis]QUI25918.1 HD domain-containing protein [Vallitalea pronyensis]